MKISIVIPTCDRTQLLRTCLDRLIPQLENQDDPLELIVCDDGRESDTRAMIANEFPTVQWYEGPKRGPAANRNLGAARATGEWLVFLDDDCIPAKQFLAAYRRAMESLRDQRTALEGATASPERPSLLWEAPQNLNGGALISCNFAIRRHEFEKFGKFDERFPVAAFEDTEFAARFSALGGKMVFIREAMVEHPLRRVPNPKKLASRWEGKVIISLDYGAPPFHVLFRLPWHVFRVIQSRFRGKEKCQANIRAAILFAGEWFLVCWSTPGWVIKHRSRPHDGFWRQYLESHDPVPKFGL